LGSVIAALGRSIYKAIAEPPDDMPSRDCVAARCIAGGDERRMATIAQLKAEAAAPAAGPARGHFDILMDA